MDADRFDAVTRLLSRGSSRRALLRLFSGSGVGLALISLGRTGGASTKTSPQVKRNEFGCVNVGNKCRGRDRACCSDRCKGKRPEPGERDRSRCVAHDASTCEAGQSLQDCGGTTADVPCTTSTGVKGSCITTTGNAAYCLREAYCHECRRDADCQPFCGAAAACVKCALCQQQGGTACASPTLGRCAFPQP
jgi:hypothetical protein